MKTKIIAPLLAFIGLGSLVVLGSSPDLVGNLLESAKVFFSNTETKTQPKQPRQIIAKPLTQEQSTLNQSKEIPDYILYEQVFSLVITFNDRAKSQEAKGEAVTQFSSYFKDEAKLTAQEDEFLTQTANNFKQDVQIVDAQAEIVIEQLRQQYPIGSLPEGQLIKPSPELLQLQEQRNKLALHYRDQLRVLLGDDKFNEFDRFVLGSFASGFRAMPVSSIPNSKDQGEEK